jgi:hypothetical protein
MNLAGAQSHAPARCYAGLQAQAATLAHIDTYFVLAVAAGAMFLLSFTPRKNNPGKKAQRPRCVNSFRSPKIQDLKTKRDSAQPSPFLRIRGFHSALVI